MFSPSNVPLKSILELGQSSKQIMPFFLFLFFSTGDGVELTGIHHTDSHSVEAMTTQFLLCLNISAFHIFNKIQLFLSSQVSCHFSRDRPVKFLVYVFERNPSILDTAIVWIMPE